MTHLSGIKACVFDALGTLIDEHSPLEAARKELARCGGDDEKLRRVVDIWPRKTLEYLWLASVMDALHALDNVRERALDYALQVADLDGPDVKKRFLASSEAQKFYGDVADVVRELHARGFKTAILSGGSREHLNGLIEGAGLADAFDAVFTADGVHAVKPDPRVYQVAIDELGLWKREICFVSGNPWDAAGAAYFGFPVVPIVRREDRRYLPEKLPENFNRPDRIQPPMFCMSELPERLAQRCDDWRSQR